MALVYYYGKFMTRTVQLKSVLVHNYESHKDPTVSQCIIMRTITTQPYVNLQKSQSFNAETHKDPMTPQKYQVGTLWLSANSPVNLKIDNDLMRSSVLKPFMRWKITILNTLYFMKYIYFFGLIGTMLNKTLAEKNIHICIFPRSS